MRISRFDNLVLIALIFLTVTVLALQEYSLDEEYIIDSSSDVIFEAISDGAEPGGQSKGSYSIKEGKIVLECNIIISEYPWPFCELTIRLHKTDSAERRLGKDLSSFDTVKIYAEFDNIEPAGIRFWARSYHSAYSKLSIQETWKYNGIEFWLTPSTNPVTIPINSLQAATWWLAEYNIPIEHSAVDLRKVMLLEISTGNNIPPGRHKIIIEKIEFSGKRFKTTDVYTGIILLWIISSIFMIYSHFSESKRRLHKAERRSGELKKLNKLLNVESESLKDQAQRDPLTGALNRIGIQSIFTSEVPILSLVFIDIDHFKPINDEYGHSVGDEILCLFSRVISENSRETDFLARWGGEEFLLVCPNTELQKASKLADNIRQLIEHHKWPNEIQLTASFGVAQRKKDEPADEFIDRADKALYAAKAQGRNRTVNSS